MCVDGIDLCNVVRVIGYVLLGDAADVGHVSPSSFYVGYAYAARHQQRRGHGLRGLYAFEVSLCQLFCLLHSGFLVLLSGRGDIAGGGSGVVDDVLQTADEHRTIPGMGDTLEPDRDRQYAVEEHRCLAAHLLFGDIAMMTEVKGAACGERIDDAAAQIADFFVDGRGATFRHGIPVTLCVEYSVGLVEHGTCHQMCRHDDSLYVGHYVRQDDRAQEQHLCQWYCEWVQDVPCVQQ